MRRRRLPRRTREAMAALWLAEHVVKHIKVYRWVSGHRRMIDQETGEPLRTERGNTRIAVTRKRMWVPCGAYNRMLVWATISHDPHADHWYWGRHAICRFTVACRECHGPRCLCPEITGPGLRWDDEE